MSCSVHITELHSIPTRRSSDLLLAVRIQEQPAQSRLIAQHRVDAVGAVFHGRVGRTHLQGGPEAVPMPVRDRKSTRLNSSHTVISYAVYCFKKKITIYTT